MSLFELQKELKKFNQASKLTGAVKDVDQLIEVLVSAREEVASANDPHTTSLTLTKLQNPVSAQLDAINVDLGRVHKSQNAFHKALSRALKETKGTLPTDHDPMASQTALINRAIAMHLLREGQFGVASTFIREAHPQSETSESLKQAQRPPSITISRPDTPPDAMITDADIPSDLTAFQSQALQEKFAGMYSILTSLRQRDLYPAIAWARENSTELEARGSNLEFELCKLQFIWLFKGPLVNGLPATEDNGVSGALKYAQENFGRFQQRHLREIQRLTCAVVYVSNLADSPYRTIFDISLAFDEVASSFTREFCSLLGLSAESPLYVAATAGALALPNLVKWTGINKAKNTEWTTQNELAFETPLPKSMLYHSIFVCPVSRGQTTDANPPIILPCGHVLARESLQKLAKGIRYKCPYCPSEGVVKDAKEIIL
ncbi:CTLH/CRA C-terminal to lish motif domain-containing protein [Xylaria bambusicola]|uniref:CTLH/CRA C-terminal to lish motif domain-containing protein n=1 Tax=Xylaria bambusicola TaxID=326684 RepID=UPI0020077EA5|nr:CTLH/CRA C-terminal to lish motif domain-containing protein [Xylaria bambusicola]KAI0506908.1 CTLH/CRA C-terminal to lish motif domain-containing protein [Xylaria bambusicola]